MLPRLAPGAVVLLDRHYNSLRPYRKGMPNMYAVSLANQCVLGFVAVAAGRIILRPHNEHWPVELIEIDPCVCHIAVEC